MSARLIPDHHGMRREKINLEVSNVSWFEDDGEPDPPTLTVTFDGDASTLDARLRDGDGDTVDADGIDVTFRLQNAPEDEGAAGVVAVTDRVTGEYVLESNADAEEMFTFVKAVRRYAERTDDDARYRIHIGAGEDPIVTYQKRTLLVYGEDGELLRQHSLIPSGVEI